MSNSVKPPSVDVNSALDALRQMFPNGDIMLMTGLLDAEVSGVWLDAADDEEAELAQELPPGVHLIISIGPVPVEQEPGIHVL